MIVVMPEFGTLGDPDSSDENIRRERARKEYFTASQKQRDKRIIQIEFYLQEMEEKQQRFPRVRTLEQVTEYEDITYVAEQLLWRRPNLVYAFAEALENVPNYEDLLDYPDDAASNDKYSLIRKAHAYISSEMGLQDPKYLALLEEAREFLTRLPSPVTMSLYFLPAQTLEAQHIIQSLSLLDTVNLETEDPQKLATDFTPGSQAMLTPEERYGTATTLGIEAEQSITFNYQAELIDRLQLLGFRIWEDGGREISFPPSDSVQEINDVYRALLEKKFIFDEQPNLHATIGGIENPSQVIPDLLLIHLFCHALGDTAFFDKIAHFDPDEGRKAVHYGGERSLCESNYSVRSSPVFIKENGQVEFREVFDHNTSPESIGRGLQVLMLLCKSLDKKSWTEFRRGFLDNVNAALSKLFAADVQINILLENYDSMVKNYDNIKDAGKDGFLNYYAERFNKTDYQMFSNGATIRYLSDFILYLAVTDNAFLLRNIQLLAGLQTRT